MMDRFVQRFLERFNAILAQGQFMPFMQPYVVMHMSSACPWGRTPGQPGEYVGEYKGMNWLLCPWAGENLRHCFEFKGKGWGDLKFCKIHRRQPRRYQGDLPLSPTIDTGNIKGVKRSKTENTRFRADALHDIILEPVFRCLYSIVLIFCNKDISYILFLQA